MDPLLDFLGVLAKAGSRFSVQLQVLAFAVAILGARATSLWLPAWAAQRLPSGLPPRMHNLATALLRRTTISFVAILLCLVGAWVLAAANLYVGLIVDLAGLMWMHALYRGLLALLDQVFDAETQTRHIQRFWAPGFAVFATTNLMNSYLNLDQLALVQVPTVFDDPLDLGTLFSALAGLYFWITGLGVAVDAALHYAEATPHLGVVRAGTTLARTAVVSLGVVFSLGMLGVSGTTFAAVSGGLSVGVGFALQDVLKNFMGGIIVLFERSVRPGDWVEVTGTEGEVAQISIRSSVVRTLDNVEYVVPNQTWLSSTVKTFTRSDRRIRARVPVQVDATADPIAVQQLMIEAAGLEEGVLAEPPPIAPFVGFEGGNLSFVLLAWIDDARLKARTQGRLRLRLWQTFTEHGIVPHAPGRHLTFDAVAANLPLEALPTSQESE